jgi:hypothetical protein
MYITEGSRFPLDLLSKSRFTSKSKTPLSVSIGVFFFIYLRNDASKVEAFNTHH